MFVPYLTAGAVRIFQVVRMIGTLVRVTLLVGLVLYVWTCGCFVRVRGDGLIITRCFVAVAVCQEFAVSTLANL